MPRNVGRKRRAVKRFQKYVAIFVTLGYSGVIATHYPTGENAVKAYALFFATIALALAYVASQALNAGAAALLLR